MQEEMAKSWVMSHTAEEIKTQFLPLEKGKILFKSPGSQSVHQGGEESLQVMGKPHTV